MAFINPEIVGLARLSFFYQSSEIAATYSNISYDFSNGFETGEVPGAAPGSPPIFADNRPGSPGIVLFLTDPVQPGNALPVPSQAGIKAQCDIVGVSTPTSPLPVYDFPFNIVSWQYGDYSLAGTPYEGVNPQKALRIVLFDRFGPSELQLKVDVSVLKNPMTIYK